MATWILRLTLLGGVAAQAAAPPGFDVASVKLVAFQRGTTSYRSDAGRIDYHQIWIKNLILKAYPLADYQIVWPAWVISQAAYYDVSATMSPATTQEQLQLMLQGLLADRFGLTSHWETRNTKVYAVEISPRGLKLRAAQNPPVNEDAMVVERGFSPLQRNVLRADLEEFGATRVPTIIASDQKGIVESMWVGSVPQILIEQMVRDVTTGVDKHDHHYARATSAEVRNMPGRSQFQVLAFKMPNDSLLPKASYIVIPPNELGVRAKYEMIHRL